jgi:hypothetical protein
LGKAVSWLNDTYEDGELGSILARIVKSGVIDHINSINTELANVKVRLGSGLKEPEVYSDQRVTDLVNVLNTYDNYIETFESIELIDGSNCLDENRYLISHDLHNLLVNGYKYIRDRKITKEEKGIYLVIFKSIKYKGDDVLIYKYIKYPYIFYECLYSYIVKESSSLVITNDHSIDVDYLFVLENMIFKNGDDLWSELKRISDLFTHKSYSINSRGIYPRNIVDLIKMLLKDCPIIGGKVFLSQFIKSALERDVLNIMIKIIDMYGFFKKDSEDMDRLSKKYAKPNMDNYNILSRVVFITEDLDSLINTLKESVDSRINQGPKPWRGQSDSLSYAIHAIDCDFRKSMNRHNQYNVDMGNIPRSSLIGRSKFQYQNIHLNIGNVRWYSTKKYITPIIQENNDIYLEIGEFIKNAPVNTDTQLKIENTLYDYSYNNLNEKISKSDEPIVNYSMINKDLSLLLIEERTRLIDYIDRSRKHSFDEEPKKVNNKILYFLNKVLNGLSDDYIISVIYGRFIKILSML